MNSLTCQIFPDTFFKKKDFRPSCIFDCYVATYPLPPKQQIESDYLFNITADSRIYKKYSLKIIHKLKMNASALSDHLQI